jgi:two-component system response regulator
MNTVRRVLFADDSERDTELALEAFAEYRLGNEVVVVRDGVEALDYLYRRGEFAGREDDLPSLVLLDLKMPRLSGIDVLRAIKGDPALRALPVVIMTSSREEQDLATCYQLGANAYVVKPVKFQGFVEAVRQLGMFWMMVNEPPPAPLMRGQPSG